MTPHYSDERLLEILRDLAAELGRPPMQRELFVRRDLPSIHAYSGHFGNWNAALEAAGLETRLRRAPTRSDEQLLQTLRDLAAELGRSPSARELQARRDLPSPATYRRYFGNWNAALEAAGLETRCRAPARSDEQLLQILRDLAAELGRSPTGSELLARRDLPALATFVNHFGNWSAALEAAGLETRGRAPARSDEQLLEILRDLAAELGRPPTQRELFVRRDLPTPTAYCGHFGSWNAALEAAGLETRRRTAFSDEQLLQILRDLAAELGRSPMRRELQARRDLPSFDTFANHFGSWNAALEAAGLATYRRPPTFSDEQLLQTLRDLAVELGRSPTQRELQARRDLPSPVTFVNYFESWTAALEAAGLATYCRPPAFSDEQLLQILRDLAVELGRSPMRRELQARHDLPSFDTFANHFGSWTAALEAAGLATYRRPPTFSDEQLLQTLRDLAAELGRSPTGSELQARRDLPSPGAYCEHFGSWTAALETAGLATRRRPPAFSDEQLLQTLRDLAAELGRSPTSRELQARRDLPAYNTYHRHFKSWNAALEAAGLETRGRTPARSDEQLLQILRDLAAELGRSPTSSELQARRDLPSLNTYCGHFGSWNAALEAAGLATYQRPPAYTDEQLLEILRDLAAELGRSPTSSELLSRRDLPSPTTYHKYFGSWNAALEAAGLATYHLPPAYTDEQLLQTLRDLAAELGRSPTSNELLARRDLPSLNIYSRHFGSWNAALEAAGLETRNRRTSALGDEQLLQTLRDLAAELGRSPTGSELQARRDLPSFNIYCGHFGSWNAALEAAGLKTRRRPAFSDEQLLQTLRDLAAELGRSPTFRELQARAGLPTPVTFVKRFGSWNAALEAAGLETRCHQALIYTDEQLLQTLRDLAAELGRSPTQRELFVRRDLPSPITYCGHFGSWNAALEAAGLETYQRTPVYSDEQLLQALCDLAAELGRPPTQRELQARHDLPSINAYYEHFGKWNTALEAAGLEIYHRRPTCADEQLLQTLRDLAAELGRSPIFCELRDRRDLPSPNTYSRHFGSWNAALEAAGLKLNRGG